MKRAALAFLGMLLIVFGGVTARAQVAVSPEKASLIKELVEAVRVQEYYLETMTSMSQFAHDQAKEMVSELIDKDKTLSPAAKATAKQMTADSVENVLGKTRQFFAKEVNFDEYVEKVFIPVFDKHFTESELREMLAFYRSSIGQKIIKETPQFTTDYLEAMSKTITPKLLEFMRQTVDEEMVSIKQKLTKKKTTRGT